MAKFLTTRQISSELEELIKDADKTLYLVSPYLKLSKDFQELVKYRNKNEKKTIIIYGKDELTTDQLEFLATLKHVLLKYHENLHAKCYINDKKLIITSLNFYDYSMINNKEMGVIYDNSIHEDIEIYTKALDYVKLIEYNSIEKLFDNMQSSTTEHKGKLPKNLNIEHDRKKVSKQNNGYCIRTGATVPFNIEKPLSYEAFKAWNEYANLDYEEKYCHFSGEKSNGQTSVRKPILSKNWNKAKEIHDL